MKTNKNIISYEDFFKKIPDLIKENYSFNEFILDDYGNPVDYKFIFVNNHFEKLIRLKKKEISHLTARNIIPEISDIIISKYKINNSKKLEIKFEHYEQLINRFFDIFVCNFLNNTFITFYLDITETKKKQLKIESLYQKQSVIRNINQHLLKSIESKKFFAEISNMLIQILHINFVWIGKVQENTVKTLCCESIIENYGLIEEKFCLNIKDNKNITKMLIDGIKMVKVNNIEANPVFLPWKNIFIENNIFSFLSLPMKFSNKIIGVVTFFSDKKFFFTIEEIRFFKEIVGDIGISIHSINQKNELSKNYKSIKHSYNQIIKIITNIVEERDPYTAGYQKRVCELSITIAKKMGLSSKQLNNLKIAATIHDLGKIMIPPSILNKPGRLNKNEMNLIKQHPEKACEILSGVKFYKDVGEIIKQHHEKLDGSGYPFGLKEKDISIEAKVLTVADVFEAMISHRPYRPALGLEKALQEIESNKGKLYDTNASNICIDIMKNNTFKFNKSSSRFEIY